MSGNQVSIRAKARLGVLILCLMAMGVSAFAQEHWMGVYMGQTKLGYMHYKVTPEGKTGFRSVSETLMKMKMLDTATEIRLSSDSLTNLKNEPLKQSIKVESAGRTTLIDAIYSPTEIKVTTNAQGTKTTKTVPIPKGIKLVDDPTFGVTNALTLKAGTEAVNYALNPLSLSLDKIVTIVKGKETIEVNGAKFETVMVEINSPSSQSKAWLNKDGKPVKLSTVLGLVMLAEPEKIAKSLPSDAPGYVPPVDLALSTSIKIDQTIDNPRELKTLQLKLSDSPQVRRIPSDKRQTLKKEGDSWQLNVKATSFDASKSLTLPIKQTKEWLDASEYMNVKDEEMKTLAKQIVGDEKNAYLAMTKIHDYVHKLMKPKANIGVPRSASEILKTKEGVCRDYAILAATLARAAGIPTKVCSGIVHFKGQFFYHAWVESMVGEWTPFDPTMSSFFVDATHIKLAEGNAGEALSFGLLDQVKVEVIAAE